MDERRRIRKIKEQVIKGEDDEKESRWRWYWW